MTLEDPHLWCYFDDHCLLKVVGVGRCSFIVCRQSFFMILAAPFPAEQAHSTVLDIHTCPVQTVSRLSLGHYNFDTEHFQTVFGFNVFRPGFCRWVYGRTLADVKSRETEWIRAAENNPCGCLQRDLKLMKRAEVCGVTETNCLLCDGTLIGWRVRWLIMWACLKASSRYVGPPVMTTDQSEASKSNS